MSGLPPSDWTASERHENSQLSSAAPAEQRSGSNRTLSTKLVPSRFLLIPSSGTNGSDFSPASKLTEKIPSPSNMASKVESNGEPQKIDRRSEQKLPFHMRQHGSELKSAKRTLSGSESDISLKRRRTRDIGAEISDNEIVTSCVNDRLARASDAFSVGGTELMDDTLDAPTRVKVKGDFDQDVRRRNKITKYNSFDDAVNLLRRSRNILVLTGAGISTSLGIPDFRSKDIGLYSKLANDGCDEPEHLFSMENFLENPARFYSVIKDIFPPISANGKLRFTPTHAFIRLLQDKEKLLTNYTQNIDDLERAAGIHDDKLIQCHGSFATASCVRCQRTSKGKNFHPILRQGNVPKCSRCTREQQEWEATKKLSQRNRKRFKVKGRKNRQESWDDSSEDEFGIEGVLKPDIVFFDENVADNYQPRLEEDIRKVDLVVVIGTSLTVDPVMQFPCAVPATVPQIYISKTKCGNANIDFDIELLGESDVIVEELARRAGSGWDLKHEMIPKSLRGVKVESMVDAEHKHLVRRLTGKEAERKTMI